ncbi:MAG: YbhN family protein [Vicinamibacterales bacterium]
MPDTPARSTRMKQIAFMAIKLAVSVALLAFLFSRVDLSSLGQRLGDASIGWLAAGLLIYFGNVLVSTWRWRLLLGTQHVSVPSTRLLGSYLVATFFNNFLPSNIGGDVVRIRDTAGPAGSKTLATTVILADRGIGLMGLVFVAAVGATRAAGLHSDGAMPIWPAWLWAGFIAGGAVAAPAVLAPSRVARALRPLTVFHPEWIGERIDRLTAALDRFRASPSAMLWCFTGAVGVQALLVLFYLSVVYAFHLPVNAWDLAVVVPVSFLLQMLPVSVNGFGIREATFSFYLTRLGVPLELAVLLPLAAQVLIMVFSLTGAAVYVMRRSHAGPAAAGL